MGLDTAGSRCSSLCSSAMPWRGWLWDRSALIVVLIPDKTKRATSLINLVALKGTQMNNNSSPFGVRLSSARTPHACKGTCLRTIQDGEDPKKVAKTYGVAWPTMRVWMSRWRKSGQIKGRPIPPSLPIVNAAPSGPIVNAAPSGHRSIYIAAGVRNLTSGAVSSNGGVWANVGQTSRDPRERISDRDYKRKQMGGKIVVLCWWLDVVSPDTDIHDRLKSDARVGWNKSTNTEEFLFMDDDGTGDVIRQKVGRIVSALNPGITLYMVRPFPSEV